ncbi:MAG: hypothetical protein ACRCVX_13190 [Shewanella sp.]
MSELLVSQTLFTTLSPLLGGGENVYNTNVSQSSNRRCARYTIVADEPFTSICGANVNYYTYRVQVDLWDETQDLVDALRQQVLAAVTSIDVFGAGAVTHIGRNPVFYEEETRQARRSDDFYVHLSA